MALTLNQSAEVYSYDLRKPEIESTGIRFSEFDLMRVSDDEPIPGLQNLRGKKKLVIEDAHVNVYRVLVCLDLILQPGDLLVVEDSIGKRDDLQLFMKTRKSRYKVDQYYVDFFGRNVTCAVDSIFKIF
jgi:cephalosporin hydroxylase